MRYSFRWLGSVVGLLCALWLTACSLTPVQTDGVYSRLAMEPLADIDAWSLEGRIALAGVKDSWSADIAWQHEPGLEQIRLSGPLGQGAVSIHLEDNFVVIARGDEAVETSDQPEQFINQQVGLSVPIRSLRYWALGLPSPENSFEDSSIGFSQAGWRVDYLQMQQVYGRAMPRKISVKNSEVKLKLIVDQWDINGKATQ